MPTATRLRRQRLRAGVIIIAVVAAGAGLIVRFSSPGKRTTTAATAPDQFGAPEARIMGMVNDARRAAGIASLESSDRLLAAARIHSEDMAAHRYVGHEGDTGDAPADRLIAAGLDYEEVAENLFSYAGADVEALPEQALKSWLGSPTPRVNLLAPQFRLAAVAIARAVDGTYFITLDLMR